MTRPSALLLAAALATPTLVPAADPIAPSAASAAARHTLEAWRAKDAATAGKKLHIICWRTRERPFPDGQRARLQAIMENIRTFYADEMERNGLGRLTFALDYDAAGGLVLHEAVGSGVYEDYTQKDSGGAIRRDCWQALRAAGLDPDRETVLIFTNLATWDPAALTFSHRSPYMGTGNQRSGICWQLDHPALAVSNLTMKTPMIRDGEYGRISLGRHNSIFIGGIAHELGHALGLPHGRETDDEARTLGTSLMGSGNRTYAEQLRGEGKGSFLTPAGALQLASHPLFSGCSKEVERPAKATFSGLRVAPGRGGFVVSGSVTGTVPVYALAGYLDPEGHNDYDARSTVAAPAADGSFEIVCNALVSGRPAELRIVALFANGATDRMSAEYIVDAAGTPDMAMMDAVFTLHPFLTALATNLPQAGAIRDTLPADSRVRRVASAILDARRDASPRPTPSAVPAAVKAIPLSRVATAQASVGWGRPVFDYLPRTDALLTSGGELFETGIYAHAPASHRYNLSGGGWTRLIGKCGLPTQPSFARGSVIFIIRADEKELFRAAAPGGNQPRSFDLDIAGARELELVTEDAGDGNTNDWALWLGVELRR